MSRLNGRRPRVAHVIAATEGGTWMVEMCDGLRARGWDPLAIINVPEGPLAEELRRRGIRYLAVSQYLMTYRRFVHRVPLLGYVANLVHLAWTIARMAALLRRERVDVVHSHVFPTLLIARIAAWLARVPVRVSMIPGPYHLQARVPRRLDRATAWMDHKVLAGSQAVDRQYRAMGHAGYRRSVIYYGPDESRFDPACARPAALRAELGLPPDAPLVGQVAYFYPVVDNFLAPPSVRGKDVKGHDTLVRAASLVLDHRPDARFVFVGHAWGEAGERVLAETRALTQRLGIAHAVRFTGRRSDIPAVLAGLDVSVQCSRNENLGGTIESLLMQAPTVATAVGGMPESVVHEQTGLLVPPDDPPALAAAILRLVEDPEYGAALARAGRERMLSGFTLKHTVEGVDAVYRSLARGRFVGRSFEGVPEPA